MKRFYFLFFIVFFYSCKKENLHKESVSGIVLHNITKQPLSNQTVLITITNFKVGPKNDEFPNGTPVYTYKYYTIKTDNAGRFATDVKVGGEWIFSAQLVNNSQYTEKKPPLSYIPFPGYMGLQIARTKYDTLFAEQPGYVRYYIKNINAASMEDNLYVSTYYANKRIWAGGFGVGGYNWLFTGITVDKTIIDTIPAESEQIVPIVWLHKKSMDTIVFKNETINVLPFATTDYYIQY